MTYHEFKKELFRTLRQQDGMKGKEVRLLEKGSVYEEPEVRRVIQLLNLSYYGKDTDQVKEDILYVVWGRRELFNLLHWKVRSMYERYQKEGWQAILPAIMAKIQDTPVGIGELPIGDGSYEQSCKHQIIRPLNFERNREQLGEAIYWRYGDVALVLYALLCDNGEDFISIKVTRHMVEEWGIADELLLTNALLNTYRKMPPRFYDARDMRPRHHWHDGVFMPGEKGRPTPLNPRDYWEQMFGYRLTTTRQMNGAIAIFYPGVQEQLAKMLGGDYFVGFTSIHEAVIHPVHHKQLPDIKNSLREINALFDDNETLTDQVYRYSTLRKSLIEV